MIAQINTGRGFGGLVNYANDIAHKNTVIIASAGVSTTTNATIVASFKAQARMRPSLKNFVGHISLSFHPDDTPRLTNEFMVEVAQEYLRRRGIVNTQFVIFRHHDQPHGHVHIVYNRVDNDGNAIKGDCNFRASASVTKALTREYGLTFGKGKRDVRRSHLKGRDAVKYQLYDTISAVLSHCHDWQTLRTALAARGITMNLVQGDDGRICGITFTDNSHGVTLSGSKIDRSLSLVQLSRMLGAPENQAHLSSLISDRDETRTDGAARGETKLAWTIPSRDGRRRSQQKEVGQSVGLLHGNTSSNEWQHEASASSQVCSDEVADGADNDGSSIGSNIAEAVAEVILQPSIAHTSGGGGGGNDRGWNDEDKEKNKKKRNGGMRR